uniref:Putative permease n=1 Tax=uncultured organism TaxID=155900 RepID=Q1EHY4_9ZZZZ|nr:putative permease [uncultured organism]
MTDFALTMRGAVRRIDRVWLAIAAVFLVLLAFLPEQALASASFALDAFVWILPFLLASVLLAAWLKAAGADRVIGATVSRSPVRAVVVFAAAGALSPFCSCGVVPLIAALLAAGVPLPAVMAFWVASPLMDPEMFVLMWAMLGLEFTLAKTLAAFGLGLAGGFATLAAQRAGLFAAPLRAISTCGSGCGTGNTYGTDGLVPMELRWAFWRDAARRAVFTAEARDIGLFLAKWLLFAFTIESLMVRWLPPETIVSHLGGENIYAIPLAVAIGVPAYLNGFAAVPLIGELMSMGMAPGAALAFLVAGGVTSLPAAMAVFALVRAPVFLWYLAVALVGSLAIGFAYQGWLAM